MCKNPIQIKDKDAFNYSKRIIFMRDPIDRFHSGFSHFHYISSVGSHFDDMPKESLYIEGRGIQKDYEAYVDYALSNKNPHWIPQIEVMTHEGKFIPNVIHKLSDIKKVWGDYFTTGKLPWDNAWTRQETTDYRANDLLNYYKDDLELWGSL